MGKHGEGLRAGPSFLKDQGEQAHSRAGPAFTSLALEFFTHPLVFSCSDDQLC